MTQQINLYNPALRARREFVTGLTSLLGGAVILLGVGLLYGYYEIQVGRLGGEAASVEALLKQRQEEVARLTDESGARQGNKDLDAQVARAEINLKGREEIREALSSGALGSSEGFAELLRAFARQAKPGVWLTGLSIGAGGGEITVSGRAINPELVPEYIQRLNREPAMRGRSFATLKISLPTPEAQAQVRPVSTSLAPLPVGPAAGATQVDRDANSGGAQAVAVRKFHEFVLGAVEAEPQHAADPAPAARKANAVPVSGARR